MKIVLLLKRVNKSQFWQFHLGGREFHRVNSVVKNSERGGEWLRWEEKVILCFSQCTGCSQRWGELPTVVPNGFSVRKGLI